MNQNRGFTLIETLVALLIIAIVLSTASRAIGLAISDVKDSYSREVASWIAANEYSDIKILGEYPDLGNSKKNVTMIGIDYQVEIAIVATPNPYFRKIDIAVSKKDNPNYVLFRTVNFISQY